jgi:short-subunit dehydrogenase
MARTGCIVNNVGIARFNPFMETSEEDLDIHINLNIKSPYLLTQRLFEANFWEFVIAIQGVVVQ